MFGLSIWEILIIVIVALAFFGARRLGDVGRMFGQAKKGFEEGLAEKRAEKETRPPAKLPAPDDRDRS